MTTAGGVLAISVTLRDPKFQLATFPAGSTPPAWAQALIKNPRAWRVAPATPEGEDLIGSLPAENEDPAPVAPEPAPARESESEAPEPTALPEPPKGGPGATKKAWAAYADSKGVKYPADASRDDIIDAVEAAE